MRYTRFAPSPTGYLHCGHILSALYVFAAADIFKCPVKLRIEDHDLSRARPEYIQSIYEDLERFHFRFCSKSIQSQKENTYLRFFKMLQEKNLIYPCSCSRKKLFEENPINADGEIIYQGHCKNFPPKESEAVAYRVMLPDENIIWKDLRLGEFTENPRAMCGDLVIKDRIKQWTYQFAAVADDFDEEIDLVVRGEDLQSSTARQIALAKMLGRCEMPHFLHHPLLYNPTGRKLSKREHDESVRAILDSGISAETLLGNICFEAGLCQKSVPQTLQSAIEIVKQSISNSSLL